MKLNDYQVGAVSTAIYPGRLAYPTLGLCGEVGELAEACDCCDVENIKKEIGDVLFYVANVAHDCDATLADVCGRKKFSKKAPKVFWNNTEAALELCIQAGVVAENTKKTIRDHDGVLQDNRRQNILKALQAIVAVLAEIAASVDTTLEKCAKLNLEKLRSRADRGKLTSDTR